MICETCHGTGKVMRDSLPVSGVMPGDPDHGGSIWEPCGDCGGCGFAHCCEGLREQPEPDR
jgi:DnaJ-class molecular chaperone